MFLKLDQEGLLYSQVYRALRRQILSGRMRPGSRLPSTRWLASELGVSRNTALLAYEQLIAEGYLTAGSHAGTNVASELPENLTFVAPDEVSRKHAIPSACAYPASPPGLPTIRSARRRFVRYCSAPRCPTTFVTGAPRLPISPMPPGIARWHAVQGGVR
jgi:GntR family transcriptional regulator / MocR family aminotransferase